jgi:hypothetical protein
MGINKIKTCTPENENKKSGWAIGNIKNVKT